jgi:hypothetical protein
MGAARERKKAMEASGIVLPEPPKKIRRTWDFYFSPPAYGDFTSVLEYLQKRMGDHGPVSEQVLAERMLAIGLKYFLAEIAKERKAHAPQLYTPGDMNAAAARLQAIKQGVK